jgi:type II secretory pathway component PulF
VRFHCTAFDRSGAMQERTIDAGSAADAGELLRREGLFVAEIQKEGRAKSTGPARTKLTGRPRGGRSKCLASFMRQMAVLVSTGTPVVDALEALENQTADPLWKGVVGDIRSRVEDGSPLSDAIGAHPKFFDTVSRSLVRAGESGGKLEVMLQRLADLTRQQLKVRQTVIGAMIYPLLLITVSINVLITMLCFVMPRFAGLFKTLDVPLPPTTKFLMALSNFLVHDWWIALLGVAAAVTGLVVWIRSAPGRRAVHTAVIRLPQIGKCSRSFYTARFARLMGLLLESKVPLLECLELTRASTVNTHYIALLDRSRDGLTRGESFSQTLSGTTLITGSVCEAIRNGERSGQIGTVLSSMADFLEEENEVLIKALTSLLEPAILITLGVVVGIVATSMFMPLFDLTAMAGGGGG